VASVAVLIPVLGRPHRVAPLVESLNLSVEQERSEGWIVRTVFVCTPGDDAEIAAVRAHEDELLFYDGGYAAKCNHATRMVDADWYLTAADDLRFHPGWLSAAIDVHEKTGAPVVGTNDLHNPSVISGLYATHLLVHRNYLERGTIDEPGLLMHEGYDHNCVDTELVETAKSRGMFAFAKDSRVEHLHPIWKGAPDDATYRKGRERHVQDRRLLAVRRRLWTSTAVQRRRLRASRVTRARQTR
jgi:hypothetical protein